MIMSFVPGTAHAQQTEDFLYSDGQKVPVTISLNSLGLLVKDGISPRQIGALADTLGLTLIRELPPGFFIFGLKDSLSRRELVEFTRDVKKQHEQLVREVGFMVNVEGAQSPNIMTDEFIAQFRGKVTKEQIEVFNGENAVQVVRENPFVKNQFLLKVSEASQIDALKMSNRYYESDLTESAYPNFIGVYTDQQTIPNDPLFNNQWHLDNTGQAGGTVDADADLPLAWDITMGARRTLIAVIENGGFDMNHPDLIPNLWVNPGEDLNNNGIIEPAEINGLDDDGNGFNDDFYGWDFRDGDNDPAPGAGENHGTAVAGVAAARGDNMLGVSGSCPNCGLMLLRTGYVNSDFDKSLAFGYAQQMGARIITNSWGGGGATPNTIAAINNATTAGVVVLFAAGNTTNDVCAGLTLDPRVSLPDVIAVSSSSNQDRKVIFAANGNCIDILAPSHRGYDPTDPFTGTLNVTTTDRTGTDGYNNVSPVALCPSIEPAPPPADARDYTLCFGGTSSATPLAAGIAGLILTVNPTLTRVQVQRLLQDTADKIEPGIAAYADNTGFSNPATGIGTHSWGRINASEAVHIAAPVVNGGKEGVDIFLRDNRLDWGNTEQPSNTLFEPTRDFIGHWRSMDIKVDAPPYQPAPTAATFDAFTDETPSAVSGETNRLYVRVRNRGPETASSVTVKLHWTQFGTALPSLPSDFWTAFPGNSTNTTQWHPLNCSGSSSPTCSISNLAYSGSSVANTIADAAQIVQFDFPAPPVDPALPNHFCLLAMIDSPQDRVLPKSRPTVPSDFVVDALTPNDNNVTHRNYVNLPTSTADSFKERFFVRNPANEAIQAVLRLKDPKMDWIIGLDSLRFDEPFTLDPNQEILVTMEVVIPELNLSGDVTILQDQVDVEPPRVMGGVTYQFRGRPVIVGPNPFSVSIHSGIATPIASFANNFDPGVNILLDVDYHFSPCLSVVGLFGYNDFKSKTVGIDDNYWLNLSANVRYNRPWTGPWSIYIGELGADYHTIFDPDVQFVHSHAGVVFRF